jgi:hypothetical protein
MTDVAVNERITVLLQPPHYMSMVRHINSMAHHAASCIMPGLTLDPPGPRTYRVTLTYVIQMMTPSQPFQAVATMPIPVFILPTLSQERLFPSDNDVVLDLLGTTWTRVNVLLNSKVQGIQCTELSLHSLPVASDP